MFECHDRSEATTVAVVSGVGAAVAQLVLTLAFSGSKYASVRRHASFAAHQVVAFVFMIVVFVVGTMGWFAPGGLPDSPIERVYNQNATARWMSAVIFGNMVFWDIPCSLIVPSLKDPLMLGHHVIMMYVAWVGAYSLPCCYYLFFFGLVELSSIPLQVVDTFHPAKGLNEFVTNSSALAALNEASRVAFAVLFFAMRNVYFPYVVVAFLLPDIMDLLPTADTTQSWILSGIALSASALMLLQLYWGTLIAKQVAKLLNGDGKKEEHKK